MPIFIEDKAVKVGGVVLPGLVKSLEITQEAAVDEIEVEGSAVKPKQAVGYEDAAIKLELIVDAAATRSAEDNVSAIYALFRAKGQEIPQPTTLICKETVTAGIGQVIFQKVTAKSTNKNDQYAVTLEFCQYLPVPITVSAGAAGGANGTSSTNMTAEYEAYLNDNRGTAPRTGDKTGQTPANDDRQPAYGDIYRERMGE